MKFYKWILFLCITVLASCTTTKNINNEPTTDNKEIPSQGSTPIGPEYPVKGTKKTFTVKIEDTNYSSYEGASAKLKEAEIIISAIMNSQEYREEVLNWTYQGDKSFVWNEGLSNLEIYEKLFAGAEALLPAVNYQMDLKVKMYYSKWVNTVGYTYPSDLFVYTNWKYYQKYDSCRIASNLTHEWTHKMGFSHNSKATVERPFTVPYAHNTIVEKLCEKAKAGKLTKVK